MAPSSEAVKNFQEQLKPAQSAPENMLNETRFRPKFQFLTLNYEKSPAEISAMTEAYSESGLPRRSDLETEAAAQGDTPTRWLPQTSVRFSRTEMSQRLSTMSLGTAPDNWGVVEPGKIYRSNFPKPQNLGYLETVRIKTIVTLVDANESPLSLEYAAYIATSNIKHVVMPLPSNKDSANNISPAHMQTLISVLGNSHLPILIHCNKGKHRTGCVVACYRKVTCGWPLTEILNEYHRYAGQKARYWDEVYIRQYSVTTPCVKLQTGRVLEAADQPKGTLHFSASAA